MFITSEIINWVVGDKSLALLSCLAGPAVFLFIEDCVKAVLKSFRANELKLFQCLLFKRKNFLKKKKQTHHLAYHIFVRLDYLFENNIRKDFLFLVQ